MQSGADPPDAGDSAASGTVRKEFEKNFPHMFTITKGELATRMESETIHDRIFGNWIIPLATFRTLESVIDFPFSYSQMLETTIKGIRHQNELAQESSEVATFRTLESVIDFPFSYSQMLETTIKGIRHQNELAQESSEVADFWNMLQGWQSVGKCMEKVHFNIRYLTKFRPINLKEDIEFKEGHPILYLNMAAISSLFSSRNSTQNITANRSSWSTILSYLKSHPAFLGTKQDRFYILLPSGNPDCVTVVKDGKVIQSPKVNRPKALCFDYLQLKEMFGLDLETEVITEDVE